MLIVYQVTEILFQDTAKKQLHKKYINNKLNMDNEKYFLVTVVLKQEQDNGNTKNITEKYLVKGFSYTDVEVKINEEFKSDPMEFSIKSMSDSKIIKIID